MNRIIALVSLIIPVAISIGLYPVGSVAVLYVAPIVLIVHFAFRRLDESGFLSNLFITAFLLRVLVAVLIYSFDLQPFFGEDSVVHEMHAFGLYQYLMGQSDVLSFVVRDWNRPWGLYYLTAGSYMVIGRNSLAIQFISCFCGGLTVAMIYLCAFKIFRNRRVAKMTGLLTAFSPAMIIWSSQTMKDGFVVFFVVTTIYFLISLQQRFSWLVLILLLLSLLGIFSVRFYVLYFAAFACVGSFVFGSERIFLNNIRWLGIMTVLLIVMAYAGVLSVGTEQLETISDIDRIQYSREVLSREAKSGYGSGTDIKTIDGAVSAFAIGFVFLMFAPFPWQFNSVRAALPLPEMLIWWALFPALIGGFYYTLKNKFREAIPVMLFTIALTIAYSFFQTNVGTAYRQRTQIQVFLFMFIAVGWTIWQERKENIHFARRAKRSPATKR